ncbi:MAG: ABC transporter ATP-binding protein [Candidatus Caldatribacteriaceae bacterium]
MVELEFRNVTKKYGDLVAVKSLSFTTKKGELIVLLGPPGAGKSSTLKMVAGIEGITSGEILMDGQVINSLDPAERDIAMAFETYALYPHLSVFENIAFPLRSPKRAHAFSEEVVRKKVLEVTQFLEIDMLLERKPKELSGGQRQRVSLARCLIREPKAFLLDEPIAHLDAKLRHKLRRELKRWQEGRGTTTLYTTTDYLEAFSVGDRIAILNRGNLEQIGTWEKIYTHPASHFVGTIVSDPPMNYVDAKIVEKDAKLFLDVKGILFQLSTPIQEKIRVLNLQEVIMGIFPSKIALFTDRMSSSLGTIVKGIVKFIELRGSRKIVFVSTEHNFTFTVQLQAEENIKPGDVVRCFFGIEEIQVFERQSKKNVIYFS